MTIRRRLFILLICLCVTAAASVLILGFREQGNTHLQTYGWSDPVTIHGPEARPVPPRIAAATSGETVIAVWDQPRGKGPLMVARVARVARSTGNDTWETRELIPGENGTGTSPEAGAETGPSLVTDLGSGLVTDLNTEPAVQVGGDGSVYVAWRGETSPSVSRGTGIYLSGVFWTRSTDRGETWQDPEPLAVFEANHSEGYEETVYSRPQISPLGGGVRIYYTSNQNPGQGWVWYRETPDGGETWTPPRTVYGSRPYDALLLTSQGSLLSLRQESDRAITITNIDEDDEEGEEEQETGGIPGRGEAARSVVGYGWPSGFFEDSSGTVWAVWDSETPEEADEESEQVYILENGTVKKSRYSGSQIWVSSSRDQGETWTQPALLTTGGSSRMGVLTQTPSGYTAIYATYPTPGTEPWREAWQWSIQAKHTQTPEIRTATVQN